MDEVCEIVPNKDKLFVLGMDYLEGYLFLMDTDVIDKIRLDTVCDGTVVFENEPAVSIHSPKGIITSSMLNEMICMLSYPTQILTWAVGLVNQGVVEIKIKQQIDDKVVEWASLAGLTLLPCKEEEEEGILLPTPELLFHVVSRPTYYKKVYRWIDDEGNSKIDVIINQPLNPTADDKKEGEALDKRFLPLLQVSIDGPNELFYERADQTTVKAHILFQRLAEPYLLTTDYSISVCV